MIIFPILSILIIASGFITVFSALRYRTAEGNYVSWIFRSKDGARRWATRDKFTPKGYQLFRAGTWMMACGALILFIYEVA